MTNIFKKAIIAKVMQCYTIISARAEKDASYKKRVLQNPREAIKEAAGFSLPPDWQLNIVEENCRLKIHIKDDRWLRRFGMSKDELKKCLGDIVV